MDYKCLNSMLVNSSRYMLLADDSNIITTDTLSMVCIYLCLPDYYVLIR